MEIFLIANPKGGAGKTTLATNLAGWFAKTGRRVVLGDLDRQQSARQWLSFRSPALPPITALAIQENGRPDYPADTSHLVLDSPAGLHGKKLEQLLRQANRIIVPVQASVFDIHATHHFLHALLAHKRCRNESLRVALVGMRIDSRTRAAGQLERYFEATGLPVIAYLRDTQNYVQAAAHGLSIFDMPAARCRQDWEHWASLLRWVDPLNIHPDKPSVDSGGGVGAGSIR